MNIYQLRDDFSISFRLESDALLLEFITESGRVLNDTIVDHSHTVPGVQVGVGILICTMIVGYLTLSFLSFLVFFLFSFSGTSIYK